MRERIEGEAAQQQVSKGFIRIVYIPDFFDRKSIEINDSQEKCRRGHDDFGWLFRLGFILKSGCSDIDDTRCDRPLVLEHVRV